MLNNWQRDPKWINTKLGTSNTTIGDFGCTISVIGNIVGVIPTVVNDRMKAVNGFANGNLVIWSKIEEAFPGIKIRRVWSYDNADVLANVPNVIVEVPAAPIGGTGSHWVQFLGNKQCADPWTGKIRPTSDFPNPTGYCVIKGTWTQPQTDTMDSLRKQRDENWNLYQGKMKELDDMRKQRDTNWNLYQTELNKPNVKYDKLKSAVVKATNEN